MIKKKGKMLPKAPSPSMVVALIALFVTLSGGAYAAEQWHKNSVGPVQLQQHAVSAGKIQDGSITARKVNTNSGQLPIGYASLYASGAIVTAGGAVDTVSKPVNGVYCFSLHRYVHGASVTLESTADLNATAVVTVPATLPCADPTTDLRVDTRTSAGTAKNEPFYILFY